MSVNAAFGRCSFGDEFLSNGSGVSITVELSGEQLAVIAERVAAILGDREAPQAAGFLDVAGAAAFLACPKSRIYALVSAGRLPHHRDGSRLLFDAGELREFVRLGGARRP